MTGKGIDMISKVDYYLGVFLVMLAVLAPHNIGPLAGAEVMADQPVLGFMALVAWWGCIGCVILKLVKLFIKSE